MEGSVMALAEKIVVDPCADSSYVASKWFEPLTGRTATRLRKLREVAAWWLQMVPFHGSLSLESTCEEWLFSVAHVIEV